MRSQNIFLGFFLFPLILIAFGTEATDLVNFLSCFHIFLRHALTVLWVLDEKGVMHVSSWVTLRLEKSIKVPE